MRDNGRATSVAPSSPILLKPEIGGVRGVACSVSLIDRLKPSLIHLLLVLFVCF